MSNRIDPNQVVLDDTTPRVAKEIFPIFQELSMYDKGSYWGWYQIYLWQEKYFTNMIEWELNGADDFITVRPVLMYLAWTYGSAGVRKNSDGSSSVFAVSDIKYKSDGTIKSAKGQIINRNGMSNTHINLTDKDTAFFQWGYRAWPALLTWKPFAETIFKFLEVAKINTITKIKKFIYIMNDNTSAAAKKELASFLDPSSPFISIIGNSNMNWNFGETENDNKQGGRVENRLEPLNLGKDVENWQDIEEYMSIYYHHLGREYNTSFKKERMISDELDVNGNNFSILNNDIREYHQSFLNNLNELFGINIEMKSLTKKEIDPTNTPKEDVDE